MSKKFAIEYSGEVVSVTDKAYNDAALKFHGEFARLNIIEER